MLMIIILILLEMTAYSPWHVESIQAFWFLRCPECPFDTKEEYIFQDHAVENHPGSFALFGKTVKEETLDNAYEIEDQNSDFHDNFDNHEPLPEPLFLSTISPEVHIKEEIPDDTETVDPNFEVTEKKMKFCKICGNEFARNSDLKRHVATIHEGEKPFKCYLCDESFSVKKSLVKHVESIHKTNYEPFKCSLCDSRYSKRSTLKEHVDSVHEGKKAFQCSECDKSFSVQTLLDKHVKAAHKKEKSNEPVLCQPVVLVFQEKVL